MILGVPRGGSSRHRTLTMGQATFHKRIFPPCSEDMMKCGEIPSPRVSLRQSLGERLHYHCQTVLTAIFSDSRSFGAPLPRLKTTVAFLAVHKGLPSYPGLQSLYPSSACK